MSLYNIEDIDLNDEKMMRVGLENWYAIEELSERHIKGLDLFIEIKDRWNNSGLKKKHRDALTAVVINGDQKKEAIADLKISPKELNTNISEGIEIMSKGLR